MLDPNRRFVNAAALGVALHVALTVLSETLRQYFQPVDTNGYGWGVGLSYSFAVLSLLTALAPGFLSGYVAPSRPMLCGAIAAFVGMTITQLLQSVFFSFSVLAFVMIAINSLLWAPYGLAAGAAGSMVRKHAF